MWEVGQGDDGARERAADGRPIVRVDFHDQYSYATRPLTEEQQRAWRAVFRIPWEFDRDGLTSVDAATCNLRAAFLAVTGLDRSDLDDEARRPHWSGDDGVIVPDNAAKGSLTAMLGLEVDFEMDVEDDVDVLCVRLHEHEAMVDYYWSMDAHGMD